MLTKVVPDTSAIINQVLSKSLNEYKIKETEYPLIHKSCPKLLHGKVKKNFKQKDIFEIFKEVSYDDLKQALAVWLDPDASAENSISSLCTAAPT